MNIIPERSKIDTQDLAVGAEIPIALDISSYLNSCPVRAAINTRKS